MKPIYRSTWVVKERKEGDCFKKNMENMWNQLLASSFIPYTSGPTQGSLAILLYCL